MSSTTSARSLVERYYALVDSGDLGDAVALMRDDVTLTFANAEPVSGRAAAHASIQTVLDRCDAIRHTVVTWFEQPGANGNTDALFEIRIAYDLKNGGHVDIPGCVFATIDATGAFVEQRLYGDLAPVFAGG
ncbi:nuclear transport factor 2 family protein [Umezawaea beigongshangensis]|uniref:nuclear transport factor 2 family protein n=1 Tax=Umezawaea beigongshangensis TaxID=2780383 RepID=UPI0018F1EDEE|nr:nuclear transport factor 2 family protein [Umezawaea beigongshangensis]